MDIDKMEQTDIDKFRQDMKDPRQVFTKEQWKATVLGLVDTIQELFDQLKACRAEIDRLEEPLESRRKAAEKTIERLKDAIEQRTKEAIWKGLNDAPTIWRKGVQYLRVSVVKQAIDSVGKK